MALCGLGFNELSYNAQKKLLINQIKPNLRDMWFMKLVDLIYLGYFHPIQKISNILKLIKFNKALIQLVMV